MLVDTYKSEVDNKKYISVPVGTDVSKLSVSELDPDYGKLVLSRSGVELDPNDPEAGLNNAAILQDIADHGFAAHFATNRPGGSA
jgi:hypothetical protein